MWDFFKNEWGKIPQAIRFLIEAGIALIFSVWILDHWNPTGTLPYKYLWRFDQREISYNIGTSLIYVSILALLLKQIFAIPKLITNYKIKYPIKKLGKTYDLVWFNGKLYLFDHTNKHYYHVRPWETAQDLEFDSYGAHVDDHFPNPKDPVINLDSGNTLNTRDYKNGGSINTTS